MRSAAGHQLHQFLRDADHLAAHAIAEQNPVAAQARKPGIIALERPRFQVDQVVYRHPLANLGRRVFQVAVEVDPPHQPGQPVEFDALALAHRADVEEQLHLLPVARQGGAQRQRDAEQQQDTETEQHPVLGHVEDHHGSEDDQQRREHPVDQVEQPQPEAAVLRTVARDQAHHGAVGQARGQQHTGHDQQRDGQVQAAFLEKGLQVALRGLRQRRLGLLDLVELELRGLQLALDKGELLLPFRQQALQVVSQRLTLRRLQQADQVGDRTLRHRQLLPVVGDLVAQFGFHPDMAGHVLHFVQRRLEQGKQLLLQAELLFLHGAQPGDVGARRDLLEVARGGDQVRFQLGEPRLDGIPFAGGAGRLQGLRQRGDILFHLQLQRDERVQGIQGYLLLVR